jgi:hypothetical protein
VRRGSFFGTFGEVFTTPALEAVKKSPNYRPMTNDHTADATLYVQFIGPKEIWFVSSDGGFHIVRLADNT